MKTLAPLIQSHAADKQEEELKRLFVKMLADGILARASDVNCYGMPHLGGMDLLIRYLVSQNLSNFAVGSMGEDRARYLVHAWRYLNPKRGTHLLRAYIKAVWGNDFEIHQLWQKKNERYPTKLKTTDEIDEERLNRNDYFLTCRLKVVLNDNTGYIDGMIAQSLNQVLPARLMVEEVQRTIAHETTVYFASSAATESTFTADIDDGAQVTEWQNSTGFADYGAVHSIMTGDI